MLQWFSGCLNTVGLSIFQQLRSYIWSRTKLLSTCQKEIAGKGSHGPKRNLLVAQLDLESIKDETVSEGLVLVQMLVWWLGRSHKHHGQRPLLGHLQGTFITRQDIGRLECQVKTRLMVMTVGNGQMFNTYPLRNQLRQLHQLQCFSADWHFDNMFHNVSQLYFCSMSVPCTHAFITNS